MLLYYLVVMPPGMPENLMARARPRASTKIRACPCPLGARINTRGHSRRQNIENFLIKKRNFQKIST